MKNRKQRVRSLIALAGLVCVALAGFAVALSRSSSSSSPVIAGLTSDVKTPPALVGAPAGECASPPGVYGAAFVNGTPEVRENGGAVRVRARFHPGYGISTISATIGAIVADAGNCFYSIHPVFKGTEAVELLMGFDGKGGMNPAAVARFLKRQHQVFQSVTIAR
jgi:hypothetical protein